MVLAAQLLGDAGAAGVFPADLNQRHAVGPGDAVLGVSSLTFDLSVYDVFGTLWAGATLVLPFASLELVAVGVAFVVYARHATDGENIYLRGAQLVVEFESGGKLERQEFRRESVRVEPRVDDHSLIKVSGQGRSINVGRFVRPELRPMLAREIRMALRGA